MAKIKIRIGNKMKIVDAFDRPERTPKQIAEMRTFRQQNIRTRGLAAITVRNMRPLK